MPMFARAAGSGMRFGITLADILLNRGVNGAGGFCRYVPISTARPACVSVHLASLTIPPDD